MWLEVISRNGFEIARCSLDCEIPETAKDFELCEAPYDQLMMLIIESHSMDSKDLENEEEEEDWEADEDEEVYGDEGGEEDEQAKDDEKGESNESNKSDGDDMDDEEEVKQSEKEEEDKKENSPEEPRTYFGLLLLPKARKADSWVRVGVFMLRSDIHGRTVLDNCSERVVRVV
ncbi:hypothetical protein DIS24_g12443 [Lasiodiplodia hormozganensis]|uniref:Uncharacterized protein n=1 Tax=Lasiodiplodia hormozganensis TaxID=869390 RepID=A0AA39TV31_9PEZI|nr:hypothetical protein DIS24_g12443 [Lasiodiplodia hormozganensis]